MTKHLTNYLKLASLCLLLILLLVPIQSFAGTSDLTVGSYSIVSKSRVGRTTYEYVLSASVTNNAIDDAFNVTGTSTSLAPTMAVTDGVLNFGDVPAGTTALSTDTITVRVDRRFPFDQANLVWSFDSNISEPDYDNDGITSNNDVCPSTPIGETVDPTGCSESQKDNDLDGVFNNLDQCPNTPANEVVDANGCSDSQKDDDADDVFNNLDQCPNTPANEVVDANGCSDSQKDDDADDVFNNLDQCPNTPANEVVDANGCSDSQKDNDTDGVFNNLDQCPNTPANEVVDANGCSDSQKDDDADGVFNNLDQCPNTPANEIVDTNGCSDSQKNDDNGVTYTYEGLPFNSFSEGPRIAGSYNSIGMKVTGSFTLDSPLQSNMPLQDIMPLTTAWKFSDGRNTFTHTSLVNLDKTSIKVATDSNARINEWYVQVSDEPTSVNRPTGAYTTKTIRFHNKWFDMGKVHLYRAGGGSVTLETAQRIHIGSYGFYGHYRPNNNGWLTYQDLDDDGVTYNLDHCSNTPTSEIVDANGCSSSQVDDDIDGDRVNNDLDECPNTPRDSDVFSNGCSDSQKDDDADGVFNNLDQCPNTPVNEKVGANGCSDSQRCISTMDGGITYMYEGLPFESFIDSPMIAGIYTTDMKLTGSFALDSPLRPDMPLQDIMPLTTAWEFSDGRTIFNNCSSLVTPEYTWIKIATDSEAKIIEWNVYVENSPTPANRPVGEHSNRAFSFTKEYEQGRITHSHSDGAGKPSHLIGSERGANYYQVSHPNYNGWHAGNDPDNDGIYNTGVDQCPDENASGFDEDKDGCIDDTDDDGVKDDVDNCPMVADPDQNDGDCDGVINDLDNCPLTPIKEIADSIGCSFSQEDEDADGVPNYLDLCLGTPIGEAVNVSGCPTNMYGDDDGDGVFNSSDLCPETPVNESVDYFGCPNYQNDEDEDGVPNDWDYCPGTPANTSVDYSGCPISQNNDEDGDGVPSYLDWCPDTPVSEAIDGNGCSDSQKDDDNDGIPNSIDQCPNTPTNEAIYVTGCSNYQITLVSNVVGLSQTMAEAAILGDGLNVGIVSTQYHAAVPTGTVISQNPVDGASVVIPSKVDLVVSLGSAQVGGVLLQGNPTDNANSAVIKFFSSDGIDISDFAEIEGFSSVALTRLRIELEPTATVENINTALTNIGANIVAMLDGVPFITISIPKVAGIDVLDELGAQLESAAGIASVLPILLPSTNELPQDVTSDDYSLIKNQLAIRMPSAWNIRSEINPADVPTVVVVDYFGKGMPNSAAFNIEASPASSITTNVGSNGGIVDCAMSIEDKMANIYQSEHGYHVLGTITSKFGGPVLGAYQGPPLPMVIVDIISGYDKDTGLCKIIDGMWLKVADAIKTTGAKILNTSLGYDGKICGASSDCRLKHAKTIASILGESNFTHVTAAGNEFGKVATEVNFLASVPSLLMNPGFVVENRTTSISSDLFTPGPLDPSSNIGGDISAIGTDVVSYIGPAGNIFKTKKMTGTSMAAPQVTGLLAYLYSLPQASGQTIGEINQIVRTTAITVAGDFNSKAIDAYAAMLALDEKDTSLGWFSGSVRQALLNFDKDVSGRFDDIDVQKFISALLQSFPDKYTKWDINGDSYLDQYKEFGFNLDRNVYGPFDIIDLPINNFNHLRFDETALSDLQVLCYYIHADKGAYFDGSATNVDTMLRNAGLPTCIGSKLIGAEIKLNDSVADWNNMPTTIRMANIDEFPRDYFLGSSGSTCSGEQGWPFWSSFVTTPVDFYASNKWVTGVPYSSHPTNRHGCSSFIALHNFYDKDPSTGESLAEVWINATQKGWKINGSTKEYQVRLYSGLPGQQSTTRTAEVGTSYNERDYIKQFDVTNWSFKLLFESGK